VSDPLSADLQALRIERDPPKRAGPSGLGRAAVTLAVLAALGGGAAYAWPRVAAQVFKTEVRVAEVLSVSPTQATTSVTATGYVVALTLSRVQPRMPGRVARVHVREGETVRAGQALLTLDAVEQRAAISASTARVLAAQARVAVARASIAEAEVNLARQRGLVAGGAAPRSVVEDIAARMGSLRASVAASEAEARAAQAEVASLRINLAQLSLSAPFDGVVMNRPPQVGEVVGAGALSGSTTANATAAVIEVMDPRSLVVEVDVPEGRLGLVRVGGPCEVSFDAFPDRRVRATVAELGRRVDRSKGTVPVRVRFVEDAAGVLPEMSARVSFLTAEVSAEARAARARTMLPAGAVASRGGAQVVFVVEDGVARARPVTLGPRAGESYELVQGPSPGARVVLSPPTALSDGSPVREVTR
jgi:RND family efflux transporter MFP subunit